MYVFRHLAELQKHPKNLQERIFTKLFEAAEIARFTPEEREAYQNSLKYYRDIKNVVDTSLAEGREEGRLEGREEGRKEGIGQVAKNMKVRGLTVSDIIELTGLSQSEIEKL